jgi:Transglutaminase-like superfamily
MLLRQLQVVTNWSWVLLLLIAFIGCHASSSPLAVIEESPKKTETSAQTIARTTKIERETWDVIFMQGQRIGYSHTKTSSDIQETEVTASVTEVNQHLQILRFGQTTKTHIRYSETKNQQQEIEQLFASMLQDKKVVTESTGQLLNGMLRMKLTSNGKDSLATIPWEAGTQGYFAVEESLRKQPLQPGETRKIQWFQPIINQVSRDELTAQQEEEVTLLNGRKKLLRVKHDMHFAGQKLSQILWVDSQGEIWRSSNTALQQESFRASRTFAEAPFTASFDLTKANVVQVNRDLSHHMMNTKIVYRGSVENRAADELKQIFPTSLSQTLDSTENNSFQLTVRKVTANEPQLDKPMPQPAAEDSAPNALIQSDAPAVTKLAQQVLPSESDPAVLIPALELFVHEKIQLKNFSQAFATAADVANTLEGDCTEHAVLFAALCRARKIPARVAAGLVYSPRDKGFAYHMWNEIWLQDRWIPFDATLAQGGIGCGHIKLFDSSLAGADAFSTFLPVISVLGQLKLEVVSVE